MSHIPSNYHHKGHIAWGHKASHPGLFEIIINNPKKKNAIAGVDEGYIADAMEIAIKDEEARVILVHGGRYFSSGNDIS